MLINWKKFNEKLNNNYPTQKMIDWFHFSFNIEPEDLDGLESDMWESERQQSFFDDFSEELKDLSYDEMLDIYLKSFDASLW
jgi:hypothetical protein